MHAEIDAWVVGGCVRHCWILHRTCSGQPQLTCHLGGLPSGASPPYWHTASTFSGAFARPSKYTAARKTSATTSHRSRRWCFWNRNTGQRFTSGEREWQIHSRLCSHTFQSRIAYSPASSRICEGVTRNCTFHHRRLVALFITTTRGKECWCLLM